VTSGASTATSSSARPPTTTPPVRPSPACPAACVQVDLGKPLVALLYEMGTAGQDGAGNADTVDTVLSCPVLCNLEGAALMLRLDVRSTRVGGRLSDKRLAGWWAAMFCRHCWLRLRCPPPAQFFQPRRPTGCATLRLATSCLTPNRLPLACMALHRLQSPAHVGLFLQELGQRLGMAEALGAAGYRPSRYAGRNAKGPWQFDPLIEKPHRFAPPDCNRWEWDGRPRPCRVGLHIGI
jgi:hypothetical protein